MKKLFVLILPVLFIAAGCSKQELVGPPVDPTPWLSQERGIVVASNFSCDYFVVETRRGYSVLRSWGGAPPFSGSTLYGNFSSWGPQTFYNRSGGYLVNADVREYWMPYFQAMDAVQQMCSGPFGY